MLRLVFAYGIAKISSISFMFDDEVGSFQEIETNFCKVADGQKESCKIGFQTLSERQKLQMHW